MRTLHLQLVKKWFDKVQALEKKEEYREIKPYWIVRLMNFRNEMWETDINDFSAELNDPFKGHNGPAECMEYYGARFRNFDQIHFKNGFARKGKPAPAFDICLPGIRIDTGKPEWGAEPGKYYFVLELGEIQPKDEIDCILKMTDEEILAEAERNGLDIDAEVKSVKTIFQQCRAQAAKDNPNPDYQGGSGFYGQY